MNRRRTAAGITMTLILALMVPWATAAAEPRSDGAGTVSARAAVQRSASVSASARQVEEGSRYTVTASITSPRQAGKVELQKLDPPDYAFQDAEWVTVRVAAVSGRNRIRFPVVATERNTEKHRVVVTYKKAKPVTSDRKSVV